MKKEKLVGKFVTDLLSGKKGIVVEKKKHNTYVVRVFVHEQSNWVTMRCPREQFKIGEDEVKKIGF